VSAVVNILHADNGFMHIPSGRIVTLSLALLSELTLVMAFQLYVLLNSNNNAQWTILCLRYVDILVGQKELL
jgi:hypothetical protein